MDLDASPALPPGWVWSTMGGIAQVVGGGTPPTGDQRNFENGDIPWITPADLTGYTAKHISSGARCITQLGLTNSGARIMPAGSVLFSSRAPIGYVAIASIPLCTNQGFKSFILGPGIASDYIYYFLKSAKDTATSLASGTTFLEISGAKAAIIPVPLAPLSEQHRIVAEIERQFSLLDAGVANLKRVQANLKRYRASVLQAACTGQLVPTEAELAQAEGRAYEPASVLLTRILAERRARWEAEQWAKKKGSSKASDHDLFSGKEVVNGSGLRPLHQGATASPGSSPLSPEWGMQGQSPAQHLTFNESVSDLDTLGVAAGSVVEQLFRKQEGSGSDKEHPQLFSRQFRYDLKGYKEPAAPDTSGLPELPEGWVWTTLGQAFGVYVGATPSRKEASYWGGDICWVSSGEVAFCRINNTREKITISGLANTSTTVHPAGTVLLGMIGEGKTRGQVAILNVAACNNQNCAAIRVSETDVPCELVYRYLEGKYDETRRAGSGNNQPALNKTSVSAMPYPLPPLAEQSRIVAEVERRLSVVDNLEQVVKANLKRAERLRQAVLKEAFAGRLVPQDPADEPASVLLERIQAEREERVKTPGKKGRGKEAPDADHRYNDTSGKAIPSGDARRKHGTADQARLQPNLFSANGT